MIIFVIFLSSIIIFTHAVLCIGILRARILEKVLKSMVLRVEDEAPTVSVVIPARDEEKNLPRLLKSLERQSYSDFELILIDDRSSDSTPSIMKDFGRKYPGKTKIVTLKENLGLENPKQFALGEGIKEATGDIILFTDADCMVPPRWVEYYRNCFKNKLTGLAFGTIYTGGWDSYLERYQIFDHLFRFYYNVACAGLNMATGVYGNNMAVRREALIEIGGYETLEYSPTEDAALLAAVRERSHYKINALTSPDITVITAPQKDWRSLVLQEVRWSKGAFFSSDIKTVFGYSTVMFYLISGTLSLFAGYFYPLLFLISLSAFVSMFSVAFCGALLSGMPLVKYRCFLPVYIIFSMFFYFYIDLLALSGVPIKWKGGKLKSKK